MISKSCEICNAEISEEARFCSSCSSIYDSMYASIMADPYKALSTTPPLQEPTPSMLVYLFADRIFEQGGRAKLRAPWKMRAPCKQDVTVSAKDLVEALFVVSFWNLREQGIIRLEPFQKKRRFLYSAPTLRVVKLKEIGPRLGLEGLILLALRDEGDDDVGTFFKRLLMTDDWREAHLYEFLIGIAAQEAIVHSYIGCIDSTSTAEEPVPEEVRNKPVKQGGVGSGALRFGIGPLHLAEELEPRWEKIATLEESFNDFVIRMQSFQSTEAELYAQLLEECAGGIRSRISRIDRPLEYTGL